MEENPIGIVLLIMLGLGLVLLKAFITAIVQEHRERRAKVLLEARREAYRQGLSDCQFVEQQQDLDFAYRLAEARKDIAKTCLAEHDLSGCREDLLALPEPV